MYDAFIKAYLANRLKLIIYARGRYLCTDIHWHLRPCLTVMWLATRPYKHEQICSMTARLCFNIYYETGSKRDFVNYCALWSVRGAFLLTLLVIKTRLYGSECAA